MKTKPICCPICGSIFATNIMAQTAKCRMCGHTFVVNNESVGVIQADLEEKETVEELSTIQKTVSKKKKSIAIRLCFFFGIFGGHHFYAGHYFLGILYLLTAGLFTIGWVVDIIRISCGKYKDADGYYIL